MTGDGAMIIAIGISLMIVLEAEKWLLRRFGIFSELAAPTPNNPALQT